MALTVVSECVPCLTEPENKRAKRPGAPGRDRVPIDPKPSAGSNHDPGSDRGPFTPLYERIFLLLDSISKTATCQSSSSAPPIKGGRLATSNRPTNTSPLSLSLKSAKPTPRQKPRRGKPGGPGAAPRIEHSARRKNQQERSLDRSVVVRPWPTGLQEGHGEGLWVIVAPAIFSRVVTFSMNVITQAFAGHIGDLELAAISIANTVVVGFNFGLMLGMASALETLCGQAFGAKKYHMMGVYMQRSWIVLFGCAVLLLPMYFFAEEALLLMGQSPELSAMAGKVSIWFIPLHFSFAFLFPLQRFLQCQMKNFVNAAVSGVALCVHLLVSWLFITRFRYGLVGIALTLNFSWWATAAMLFAYVACGGCPDTWHGFSFEALADIWDFVKLSTASGVMLCLENWYYRILVLLTGNLKNAAIAVDALSICMTINGWEMMIPLAFFAGTGVRVANELGAGNGKGARFATIVSTLTSLVIGLFFWVLVMCLHDKFALIFTSSAVVLDAVNNLAVLLAFTILLNSIQPVLSGVAVGSGWQSMVAYVNIGSYYIIGIPMGILLGWLFNLGVLGIWAGMIGGTAVQTLILAIITIRCDWEKEALIASTRMDKWSEVR